MFDFMVRILDNNRILVRDNRDKTSQVLRAGEVSTFFEKVLEDQLEAQEAGEKRIAEIKQGLEGSDEQEG